MIQFISSDCVNPHPLGTLAVQTDAVAVIERVCQSKRNIFLFTETSKAAVHQIQRSPF